MVLESHGLNKFYFYKFESAYSQIKGLDNELTNLKDETNRLLCEKKNLESEINRLKIPEVLKSQNRFEILQIYLENYISFDIN